MSVEADFLLALQSATGVTAVVSSRVYPNIMPEATPLPGPTLVLKVITSPWELVHSGNPGLRFTHYQFDFYAAAKEDTIAGRDALNAFLAGLSATFGSTLFEGCVHARESDFYERETRLYRALVEWEIWHSA
jgi:hypothetical protein